ncbi:hypothetical protein BC827DRAFT_801158 [Russula dissimulans]|nr:hypothetical protein BC827DRAFT_801158 [Russula dissimulans]
MDGDTSKTEPALFSSTNPNNGSANSEGRRSTTGANSNALQYSNSTYSVARPVRPAPMSRYRSSKSNPISHSLIREGAYPVYSTVFGGSTFGVLSNLKHGVSLSQIRPRTRSPVALRGLIRPPRVGGLDIGTGAPGSCYHAVPVSRGMAGCGRATIAHDGAQGL